MAKSLQSILGYVTLTKAIQATSSGIPNELPAALFKTTDKCIMDRGRYVQYYGQRKVARLTNYGAPARHRELKEIRERDFRCLHSFEAITLDPLTLKYLRSADSYELDKGLSEVKRQEHEFAELFQNARVAAVAMTLRNGLLYYDANGGLLPTSSGAYHSHDFQIPANNKNQLNGIISASWAVSSTNIPLQLFNLRRQSLKDTGKKLKYALVGRNIPTYLTQNDYVLDYLARSQKWSEPYLAGSGTGADNDSGIPNGLFGFTWVYVDSMFYEDQSGTNQDLWGADSIVFLPEIDESWWRLTEGSYEVPTSIDIAASGSAAMGSMATVHGMFGYAAPVHNPPSIVNYAGDTFCPLIANSAAVYTADVTP